MTFFVLFLALAGGAAPSRSATRAGANDALVAVENAHHAEISHADHPGAVGTPVDLRRAEFAELVLRVLDARVDGRPVVWVQGFERVGQFRVAFDVADNGIRVVCVSCRESAEKSTAMASVALT